MTNRTQWGFLALVFALGLAGCEVPVRCRPHRRPAPSPSPSTAPSPSPVSATPTLIVFTEPGTGFSTSEVRDVQEQVLQINTANELIWTADGTRLPGYRVEIAIRGVLHRRQDMRRRLCLRSPLWNQGRREARLPDGRLRPRQPWHARGCRGFGRRIGRDSYKHLRAWILHLVWCRHRGDAGRDRTGRRSCCLLRRWQRFSRCNDRSRWVLYPLGDV